MGEWTSYRVVDVQHDQALAKIEKLNKRWAKLGLPQIETEFRGEREFIIDPDASHRVIEYRTIYMRVPELPAIDGWQIVGTIHPSSSGEGNIVRRIPGAIADLTAYYNVPFMCDHCGYLRRRNDTFVVQNTETAEMKQVGSTCMGDFLRGGSDPHAIMKMAEELVDIVEFVAKPRPRKEYGKIADDTIHTVPLDFFLAMVNRKIREYRWVSKKEAWESRGRKVATATAAWDAMRSQVEIDSIAPADFGAAREIIDWARATLSADDESEYIHNLAVITTGDFCSYRESGLVASIWAARRNHEKRAKAAPKKEDATGYVGKPKERLQPITMKVTAIKDISGQFTKIIHKMEDGDGNHYAWFASVDPDLEIGKEYEIVGTVKDHREFRGEKETILTRCKVLS